jgi:hypothetical protein
MSACFYLPAPHHQVHVDTRGPEMREAKREQSMYALGQDVASAAPSFLVNFEVGIGHCRASE